MQMESTSTITNETRALSMNACATLVYPNIVLWLLANKHVFIPRSPKGEEGYAVLPLSVLPSKIFFVAFFSATVNGRNLIYRYTILWVVFLDPSDSLLPVCRLWWFLYTLNIYAHFSSHFSQQLMMAEIWYLVTGFI